MHTHGKDKGIIMIVCSTATLCLAYICSLINENGSNFIVQLLKDNIQIA